MYMEQHWTISLMCMQISSFFISFFHYILFIWQMLLSKSSYSSAFKVHVLSVCMLPGNQTQHFCH